mmetsp:Transcript_20268/g.47330  ORF Transcript_20268/g.47330 Transcript_20268/m.47330 type:complete len:630 (+) Transcript_20268:87-1976(+)
MACVVVVAGGLSTAVGQAFCKTLLRSGSWHGAAVSEVLILEDAEVSPRPSFCSDERVEVEIGSFDGSGGFPFREPLSSSDKVSILHFAGLSGPGKADHLEHCIRINVELTRNLLAAARSIIDAGLVTAPIHFVLLTLNSAAPVSLQQQWSGAAVKDWRGTHYGNTQAMGEQLVWDSRHQCGQTLNALCVRAPGLLALDSSQPPPGSVRDEVSRAVSCALEGSNYSLAMPSSVAFCVTTIPALLRNLILIHDLELDSLASSLRERIQLSAIHLPGLMTDLPGLLAGCEAAAPEKGPHLGKITYSATQVGAESACGIDSNTWVDELQFASTLGLEQSPPMQLFWEQVLAMDRSTSKASQDSERGGSTSAAQSQSQQPRKVAVVTGAGSGVGRAAAIALVKKAGFDSIALLGRRMDALEETASLLQQAEGRPQLECWWASCNVSDAAEVAKVFGQIHERFGRCDLLFNNAGVGAPQVPVDELPTEAWDRCVGTNLTGTFLCSREAIRLMKQQVPRGGRIINNGSVSADRPRPNTAPYTATKHAITGLTKSFALDGRAFDIACGQIDIGNAETSMSERLGQGAMQPTGEVLAEPLFDVEHVGDALAYMACLPLSANVPFITVMATKMPLYGRG